MGSEISSCQSEEIPYGRWGTLYFEHSSMVTLIHSQVWVCLSSSSPSYVSHSTSHDGNLLITYYESVTPTSDKNLLVG